ncbi:DUF1990 family protein [Flexivirga alba]|uniref:DUF1990 family protein n=1 Tax=Flexivirga alba TaxID=702742 RepID=A0ABW2AHU2_9MICO
MTDEVGTMRPNYRRTDLSSGHGYRQAKVERDIAGSFPELAEFVMTFGLQRAVWRDVWSSGPSAQVGVEVRMAPGIGRFRLHAPARVVEVLEDGDRFGFTYGTLQGHPEAGEERFVVERRADGTVQLEIEHWSRPARWFTQLAGPLARLAQSRATAAYLQAAERHARDSASG